MQQVWINLMNNAIKFSHPGGDISVRLKAAHTITVAIRDHGVGMDEETRKRIFDRFYQGDTSHQDDGNGLGLALVKRIVDVAMGTLRVESAPGQGSAFIVELPLEPPEQKEKP